MPGHIDILVNNARALIGRDRVGITDLREAVWQRFLRVNTTAVFLCTKFAGRIMIEQGKGGRIINIADDDAAFITGQSYNVNGGTLSH